MKKLIFLFFIIIYNMVYFSLTLYTYPQDNVKFFDEKGQLTGISHKFVEILNERLKKYNIKIKYKSTYPKNLSEILSALEKDEIQTFIGLAKNEERLKKFKFTNYPLWSVRLALLSKKKNINLSNFKRKKIGVITNSKTAKLSKMYFKDATFIEFNNISKAIENLLNNKIDFVSYNSFILEYYQKLYQDNLKFINIKTEKYRQYIAFSKNVDGKVIEIFDNVLKELFNTNDFEKLFDNYYGIIPGNIVELASIQWPPYEYYENGKWYGIDYEILNIALKELGLKLVTYLYPWSRCIQLAKSKATDILLSLRKTKVREQYLFFSSIPISYGKDVYFFLKGNPYRNIAGYIKGYAYPKEFFKSPYKKVPVDSDERGMILLSQKRIDLFITNLYVGLFYANKYKIDVEYSKTIKEQEYYVGFSKTYFGKFLSEQITKLLERFRKDETYKKVYEKYNIPWEELNVK
ncbi:polar amino acid transport system substrate-binding protein [Thermosipho japonicus]|uniref:Polar amino acid transport system substrate-binding protein n=1 Tax=Thermosipho japonicus TaxID=90323 RepID=A0A841GJC7_9BACT|nr:transporter substrate-binding domain-containing protein [Thermosipho japonicus]MBB6062115.1 polar amino acid transport system substrate-binding protein [Thermosipho japonicus]